MKKGQQNYFMIVVIIAVLSLVVGIILFVNLGGQLRENQDVNDAFCKSKIDALSKDLEPELTSAWGDALQNVFKSFRASCTTQTEVVDPQNWDACDSSFKALSKTEPTAAATNCAMQQVSDKVQRCWEMSGEGRRTAFSWACFNVVISEASETPEVSSYTEFKNQIIKSFNCPLFDGTCKDYARDSIDPATILAAYNNLIDITELSTKSKIDFCRITELSQDDLSTEQEMYETELINKRIEEIYSELINSNVNSVLEKYVVDKMVEHGDSEIDCTLNTLTTEVKSNLEQIEEYNSDLEPFENSVLRKYNSAHNSELSELPFQLMKDTRLETETITFTELELKNFMKNIPIQEQSISYCDSISYKGKDCEDRVEYYPNGFKLKQNKLFSIEYCGDRLPFGSSLVATSVCEQGDDQRRILISDSPTGGGSRLINENLDYNCPILETAAGLELPFIETGISNPFGAAETICKKGVVRTLTS